MHCLTCKDDQGCPAAVYWHPEYRLAVLLLTSSFHTGEVSEDYKQKLTALGVDSEEMLRARVEEEHGYFSGAYVMAVKEMLAEWRGSMDSAEVLEYRGVATVHHNIYGESNKPLGTEHGVEMLDVVTEAGFRHLLHGHTHKVCDCHSHGERAVTVGCGSLSAKHLSDDGNSISLLRLKDKLSGIAYLH